MGHLQNFERELRERLAKGVTEETIRWIKEQLLASYRNGLAMQRAADSDSERVEKIARRNYQQ